ncbi:glycosyltransferase family 2 protein [Robiginitalea sp. IMCC44478]|uniref:glycosyltransferase family 2 protein n=1 Tax=Robiginitalea sp. IMCC44478 TaxID=3459122 RepID=UPI004042BD5C
MTKMNTPLVSVGIPFFNAEKYLGYAILSVLQQEYENWELILLDDGSTDNSLNIARKFDKIDARILVISDGENLGLPKRLNQLNDLAKGKFYFRMDADDIMFPNRISRQVKYLEENEKVDLVGSGLISINNHNQILGKRKGDTKESYCLKDILNGGWSVHPTIAGKTEWFKKNLYDEELKRSQDYDLWLRTVEKSNFSKIEEPLLFYREASTPSLKKYIVASKNSLKIYNKNIQIIGLKNYIKLSVFQIVKLLVYFLFDIVGQTNQLIQRRSNIMDEQAISIYHEKLKHSINWEIPTSLPK